MSTSFANAVYYPSWAVYNGKPPSCLQVERISHVFYAFVGVNEDGSFRLLDEWADLSKDIDGEKGCLAALSKLKRQNPHLRTIVSMGGASSSTEFAKLAASPAARRMFANQALGFCTRYSLDGIDIDWEHPQTREQGGDFLKLLREIRQTLPAPNFLLTTALPVGQYCLKHIDLAAASHILDFLNLMGYDFTGSWTDVSGHHASLLPPAGNIEHVYPTLRQSCSAGLDYILSRGFPSQKILLGVPIYARYFPRAHGPGQPFSNSGEMDYCDLPDEWVKNAQIDETVGAASVVDASGEKGFVSFDVPQTVLMKGRYAKAMALGGLFYWTGSADRFGEESLVAAGWRAGTEC